MGADNIFDKRESEMKNQKEVIDNVVKEEKYQKTKALNGIAIKLGEQVHDEIYKLIDETVSFWFDDEIQRSIINNVRNGIFHMHLNANRLRMLQNNYPKLMHECLSILFKDAFHFEFNNDLGDDDFYIALVSIKASNLIHGK